MKSEFVGEYRVLELVGEGSFGKVRVGSGKGMIWVDVECLFQLMSIIS